MKTDDERIVAVLHDVVEDTAWTCDDLYWPVSYTHLTLPTTPYV